MKKVSLFMLFLAVNFSICCGNLNTLGKKGKIRPDSWTAGDEEGSRYYTKKGKWCQIGWGKAWALRNFQPRQSIELDTQGDYKGKRKLYYIGDFTEIGLLGFF
jgi:hypothetical protein